MTDRETKFHECVKRTLLLDNGKKISPAFMCIANNAGLENPCHGSDGNIPSSDPEYKENGLEGLISGRNCLGCPFCRIFYYFGEAVHFFKDCFIVAKKNEEMYPTFIDTVRTRVIIGLFLPLIAKVRMRCYLTLTERECEHFRDKIEACSITELIKLLTDIEIFCKENNIR